MTYNIDPNVFAEVSAMVIVACTVTSVTLGINYDTTEAAPAEYITGDPPLELKFTKAYEPACDAPDLKIYFKAESLNTNKQFNEPVLYLPHSVSFSSSDSE